MSALQRHMQKANLPPMVPVTASVGATGRRGFGRKRDFTPVSWDKYFDAEEDVKVSEGNVFKVYKAGDCGPVLVFLHGGGYSGLTWSLLAANMMKLVECQVIAIDLRGHGSSMSNDDDDLSETAMSSDVGQVIKKMYGEEAPPIILIGHSMGGAIAVHVAHQNLISSLLGLVVIDVVEGTAMDALQSMQSFLRGRPSSFRSIENAIEWCVRSGQVRNLESARVSMPGQIKNSLSGKPCTQEIEERKAEVAPSDHIDGPSLHLENSIREESEEEEDDEGSRQQSPKKSKSEGGHFKVPSSPLAESMKYTWRIDLSKTEKYWAGWFQGLSNMFLACPTAKMLLLAGVDRLDKDLTIGHMQGKFQMQVLPQCGHAVHEDVPDRVAEVLASFMVRNKFVQPTDEFHMTLPGC